MNILKKRERGNNSAQLSEMNNRLTRREDYRLNSKHFFSVKNIFCYIFYCMAVLSEHALTSSVYNLEK